MSEQDLHTGLLRNQLPAQQCAEQRDMTMDMTEQSKPSKCIRWKRIWDFLRHIPSFTIRVLRLVAFVLFLLPAFISFAWHYMMCDRVAVYYGSSDRDENADGETINTHKDPFFSRHYLDIYGSKNSVTISLNEKKPVVIFLTGGAWIIGYRMWGTLLARALAPMGILCILPDYRNFPRVTVEGMVQDVDMSIQWVFDHVEEYGGDKEKVVLVGQSAGGHLGGAVVAMKVLDWLCKEQRKASPMSKGEEEISCCEDKPALKSTYSPHQLRGFIPTSSPLNLVTMRPLFHHHGLSSSMQKTIFGGLREHQNSSQEEGDEVFEKWSPYHLMLRCHREHIKLLKLHDENGTSPPPELEEIFPRYCVIHGTADQTVPISEAKKFITLLSELQIPTSKIFYEEWSHTDPILEAPMCGDHRYHRDVYELVRTWTGSRDSSNSGNRTIQRHGPQPLFEFDDRHPMLQPICPSVLVEAARYCNPF